MPAVASVDPVHIAVYNALVASAALFAIVGSRIYDTVAPSSALNSARVVIGQPTEVPWSAINRKGNRNGLFLHFWSKDAATRGTATTNAMYTAAKAALDEVRLTLSTGTFIDGSLSLLQNQLDVDLVSMHAVARYEATGRV